MFLATARQNARWGVARLKPLSSFAAATTTADQPKARGPGTESRTVYDRTHSSTAHPLATVRVLFATPLQRDWRCGRCTDMLWRPARSRPMASSTLWSASVMRGVSGPPWCPLWSGSSK